MSYLFSQLPAIENVQVVLGNNLTLPFTIGSDVTTNNTTSFVASNITGVTFNANMTVNSVVISGNIRVLSTANGSIAVDYTKDQISSLGIGFGSHAVDMTQTTGYLRTIIAGSVEVIIRG